jgi:hypothetical protein
MPKKDVSRSPGRSYPCEAAKRRGLRTPGDGFDVITIVSFLYPLHSRSCSSLMLPTNSSRMSSKVTRPATFLPALMAAMNSCLNGARRTENVTTLHDGLAKVESGDWQG